MDSVVSEPRVPLDTRLFSEDVVVLAFEVGHYFLESRNTRARIQLKRKKNGNGGHAPVFIVNVIPKPRCVDNRQRDSDTVFFKFWRGAIVKNEAG